jgi:hypothetical protein
LRPQSGPFFVGQLEGEVGREPFGVSLDLFVQAFGSNSVRCGEVVAEDDALASDLDD